MENSYGIGVANRYALFLDDESDPLEALKLKEQEKELKKKTKVAEKENKGKTEVPVKVKTVPVQKKVIKEAPNHKVQDIKREESKPNNQRSTENKPERTYNKFNNENREERNNRRNREDRPYNGPSENNREERPRREQGGENFENRRGRPVGNKTGGRGGPKRQFDDRRGKREFDRQSGSDKTGVKPVDKRDGGGARNWGSHKDVIDSEADKTNEEAAWDTEKSDPVNTSGESKEPEPEVGVTPTEEEPKELTLDEWKAQRAGRLKPQYNIRKAGEGEDPSQWKKMYELNKKKDGDEDETDDEEYDVSEYPQRVGRQKHVLDINIHFNDARRGGGGRGRGGRGAGRGGARNNRENRGGGGGSERAGSGTASTTGSGGGNGGGDRQGNRYRGNEEQGEERNDTRGAPKVHDERDFPSLG